MEVCLSGADALETVLLKVNGTVCNLSCVYCSEKRKKHAGRFSKAYLERLFTSLSPNADVIMHGGEPLLNEDDTKEIIDLHYELRAKAIGIQTNGCCTNAVRRVLAAAQEKVKIGLSIDGPALCNVYRVRCDQTPAFDAAVDFLNFTNNHGIKVKCIATINNVNVHYPHEIVDFFAEFPSVWSVRLNPCFDVEADHLAPYAVHPDDFLSFLIETAKHWMNCNYACKYRLDPIFASRGVTEVASNIRKRPCSRYISLYPDNTCTLCDTLGEKVIVHRADSPFDSVELAHLSPPPSHCDICTDTDCSGGCPAILKRFACNRELARAYCRYRRGYTKIIKTLAALSTDWHG